MPLPPRRRLVSLTTAAVLSLALPAAGATLVAAPAQSADPVADCVAPFPVSEIADGDQVEGLTVVQGTTPTGFTGEILGILEDGIAPDVDMIMVDLDMPEFARSGGVWQGMSGSPVYAADGRLIGAVAYGLSNGPSPIAGVTPFEDMDEYLAGSPAPRATPKRLNTAQARLVADRAGTTPARAAQGFRELPMPLGVSGITSRRLAQLQDKGTPLVEKNSYVLGKATSRAAGPETIVAGGNLASSVATGDVTLAGVGTATSVCGGRVVGFGHPLAYLGSTTEALHPADAVYIQPDSLGSPFKVANVAPAVGTITDDRLTGITGSFGALPTTLGITSRVDLGTKSRTGTTAVSVPRFAGQATFFQLVANQDRVTDGPLSGSEVLTWTITGTDNGKAFSLTYTDRWTSGDLSEPAYGVATLVDEINAIEGVSVGSVDVAADVDDSLQRHTLVGIDQRRGGKWFRVSDRSPVVGTPGKSLVLRLVLGGSAGKRTKVLAPVAIPKSARGTLVLLAQGGEQGFDFGDGEGGQEVTVASIRRGLAQQLRHDQVRVQVGTPDRLDIGYDEGEGYFGRQGRGGSFLRTQTTAPQAHVISGTTLVPVVLR